MLLLVYIRLLECTGYLCAFKNMYIWGYSLYFLNKQDSWMIVNESMMQIKIYF